MAKNFNYKKLKAVSDSRKQRVSDMRSGGSGSLRSSLFNRTDEAITEDDIKTFKQNFGDTADFQIDGGEWKDTGKQVMQVTLTIPDKVSINHVEALLAKVDYDKNKKEFTALYRPKNGKWSQAQGTGRKLGK